MPVIVNHDYKCDYIYGVTAVCNFEKYSRTLWKWLRVESSHRDVCSMWIFNDGFNVKLDNDEYFYKLGGE